MDLIKTGLGISQTIKNVSRFKEIASVLARNGFDEFIIKTGLQSKIPNFVIPKSRLEKALTEYEKEDWAHTIGYRLRTSFEELGPSFVKLGQLLSTREDIFPPSFVQEMKKLQDKVIGIAFEEAQGVIERSLGKSIDKIFSDINHDPIGTASIGVAYQGRLLSGEIVVIKVRRPNILKTIKTDFDLLNVIITQIEKVSKEIKILGLSRIVRDFGSYLETELDYRIEALNCEKLRTSISNFDDNKVFYLPKIYKDYSTDEVLVMEYIDGIAFTDTDKVNQVKDVIHAKLERGIRVFVHNLLQDGVFHADLHGGNFFLMENKKLGLIDFGLVGTLGKKSRANLVAILYSLTTNNYENLVYEFLDVAEYESIPDVDDLIRDIKECLAPYVGLTAQQVNVSHLFRAILSTLAQHQLYLPREWFIVFRALVALDGVGKSLDMDFDVFAIIDSDIKEIIKDFFSKEEIVEEAIWVGRDLLASVRGFPRHLRWFLKEFSKRNYALEVVQRGYEKEFKSLIGSIGFLGFSFVSGVLGFSGVYLLKGMSIDSVSSIPVLVWVFWVLAVLLFGGGIIFRKR